MEGAPENGKELSHSAHAGGMNESPQQHDFWEKFIEEVCFLFFLQIFSEVFPILRRIQQGIVINVQMCLCIVSIILLKF